MLEKISLGPNKTWTFEEFQKEYTQAGLGDFGLLWQSETADELRDIGLLVI
jgi:hypothetical protein